MGEKLTEMASGNGICMWNSNMPELEQRTQSVIPTFEQALWEHDGQGFVENFKRRYTLY